MRWKELIQRSPIRILEKSLHGGLGVGNIGIIASHAGVGKTACLVHIATDKLFQNKQVIHVSFSDETQHVLSWYDDIFSEVAKRYNLEDVQYIHDTIAKNRIIMNFKQDGIHIPQIQEKIRILVENSQFNASTIIFDGYDFSTSSIEEIKNLKEFASSIHADIWFSLVVPDEEHLHTASAIPQQIQPFINEIAIVILLIPHTNFIHLKCIKDHDNTNIEELSVNLDPVILLLA